MESLRHHRVVVTRHGGPEVLKVIEEEAPRPQLKEARVRVSAAGVSALDLMVRRAGFPGFPRVPFTPGVDAAEAVCVVANYLTAYGMLNRVAEVKDGEKILVQGAAGGVGTAMLQLGKLAGLEMYGTASERIPLLQAARGHELLEGGNYAGKVVLISSADQIVPNPAS